MHYIQSPILTSNRIKHGFFTRQGGVSTGIYDSLNCAYGSADNPDHITINRSRIAGEFGASPENLVTVYQVHGTDVAQVAEPWSRQNAPRADALVTNQKGLVLAILTADCAPVLFADPENGVIGAAHAGWKGALSGIIPETIKAMISLGASLENINAAIGPSIGPHSYEVQDSFAENFLNETPDNQIFFLPATQKGHQLFDIQGYCTAKLEAAGIKQIDCTGHDTRAEEELFFSYRRSCLNGEPDYGRQVSAILLEK